MQRNIARYIAVSNDKNALEALEKEEGFKSVDVDAVRLLNACTNSNIEIQEGVEKMDMCKGLKELLEDKMEQGMEQGIDLGASRKLKELVEKKLKQGDSLQKIADDLMEDIHVIEENIKEINAE